MEPITTIAFDADDTLWVNEPIFTKTRERFEAVLSAYRSVNTLEHELYQVEKRNLRLFGYGIKGFMLSMIETAIELTSESIKAKDIQAIVDLGKEMLEHPVEVLPGVKEVIEGLKKDYQVMIITKGDLFDQESKIARSGIARHFRHVEIVSEKDAASYQHILQRYAIPKENFLMVGNSLKSDILPICELGARAVHIPFHDTWAHEVVQENETNGVNYTELSSIKELPVFLERIKK